MQIATWNVNSLKVRLNHVLQWLATHPVDVLCLQEIKMVDEVFPYAAFSEIGYQVACSGQKTYNGVAILAKQAMADIVTAIPQYQDEQKRVLAASIGSVRVINLYVPNGQAVDSEKYQYKMAWLKACTNWFKAEQKQYTQMLVVGDMNIAPYDEDVHDPLAWKDQVLCSEAERAWFKEWQNMGLHDAFRLFAQKEKTYSWWDYRQLAFRMNKGLRIDHILLSEPLKQLCTACEIDRTPRTWEQPSDHTPVIVTLS